jgi:hypothetical protein
MHDIGVVAFGHRLCIELSGARSLCLPGRYFDLLKRKVLGTCWMGCSYDTWNRITLF